MSAAEEKAASIQGPVAAADPTGLTGVHRYAVSGSAQNAAIPVELRSKYIDLYCTANVQYAFSCTGTAITIALNEPAALGTGDVNAGKTLPAGIDKSVLVPVTATHICWIGTAGFLEIVCSEARAVL